MSGSQRKNRLSLPIAGLILGLSMMLFSWAFVSPAGSSADDNFHLPSIWCSDGNSKNLCEVDGTEFKVPAQIANRNMLCYVIWIDRDLSAYNKNATCIYEKKGMEKVSYLNQNVQLYPKLFYLISGKFAGADIDQSILQIRFLWGIVLILLLFWSLTEAKLIGNATVAGALITAMAPLSFFLIPSTNPSSGAIISMICLGFALKGFFESPGLAWASIRSYLLILILFLLGSGSRPDSAIYLCLVTFAGLLYWRKVPNLLAKSLALFPCLYLGVSQFLASNATRMALEDGLGAAPAGFESKFALNFHNMIHFHEYILGFWGYHWGLGWKFEPPIPNSISLVIAGCFAWIFIFYIAPNLTRGGRLIFAFALLSTFVISLYVMHTSNAVVGEIVQPRYLYPYFLGLLSLLLAIRKDKETKNSLLMHPVVRTLPIAISLTLSSFVFKTTLERNINGLEKGGIGLSQDSWWWQNMTVRPEAIVSLNLVASCILLLTLIVDSGKSQARRK